MTVNGFSGDTGNGLQSNDGGSGQYYQSGQPFSTWDNPHYVPGNTVNIAAFYGGGFWYKVDCSACLNSAPATSILWFDSPPSVPNVLIKTVRMMIKKNPSP